MAGVGFTSCSSASRLPRSSVLMLFTPVTLPPGRFRLATKPLPQKSSRPP